MKSTPHIARPWLMATLILCSSAGLKAQNPAFKFTIAAPGKVAAIYKPSQCPRSVAMTIEDLISDCKKVTGLSMPTVSQLTLNENCIIPITLESEEYRALVKAGKLQGEALTGKMDSFAIIPVDQALVVLGQNNRGVSYGLYTISEEAFGIDPTYYWTDQKPGHRENVILSYTRAPQIPDFNYRGFFINDENYLLYWKSASPKIEPEVFRAAIETMLRLKGNMFSVISYAKTCPSLGWETMDYLRDRDVYVTGSHADTLLTQGGLDFKTWSQKECGKAVRYDYTKHPDVIQNYWRYTLRNYKKYPAIWPLGMRALVDADYSDPAFDQLNIMQQTEFMQQVIADQVRILTEELGTSDYVTSYTARGKLSDYYKHGLKLPKNCIMVWQDNGSSSRMNKISPSAQDGQKRGIYYHLSYCDNQWVQWVPADIIGREMVESYQLDAHEYALHNVQDMREIPLAMYVGMDAIWHTRDWISDRQRSQAVVDKWIEHQFGTRKIAEIRALYQDYHDLERAMRCMSIHESILPLLKQALKSPRDPSWFAQQNFTTASRLNVSPEKMAAKRAPWQALFQRATRLHQELGAQEGRQFFADNILLHIITSMQINEWGYATYQAFRAIGAHDRDQAVAALTASQKAIETLEAARQQAMHDQWADWFRGDDQGPWHNHGWGLGCKTLIERAEALKLLAVKAAKP